MQDRRIRLGTSSWTGEGWVGSFYPANAKPQDFLPIYAREFDTVEIDSTFYRVPNPHSRQADPGIGLFRALEGFGLVSGFPFPDNPFVGSWPVLGGRA